MELDEAFKVGFLYVPPQNFLRKTWVKKYCALFNASNHGIQRLEVFENEDAYLKQNPSKLIPLSDCIKATTAPQKQQANVFEIRTKDNGYQQFSAESFQDMTEWLGALQTVAFGTQRPISALNPSLQIVKEAKQEENTLYSSMDEPEVYSIKTSITDASMRNGLQGDYKLVITSVNLSIAEETSNGRIGRIILTWPYRHIRRYGCSKDNFSFEAGRKCSSGEGLFTFTTFDGMYIFQSVDAHVSALKTTLDESEIPSSPSHCEDKERFFASKDSLKHINESSLKTTIKTGDSFTAISKKQSEICIAGKESKTSNVKPLPVKKPPRKSKPIYRAYKHCSDEASVSDPSNIDSTSPVNVYEEIYRKNFSENVNKNLDQTSKPLRGQAEDAALASQKQYEQAQGSYKLSLNEDSKSLNCISIEKHPLHSSTCQSGHDHIFQNKSPNPRRNSEHVYGRLLPKQSIPINSAVSSGYGSISPRVYAKDDSSPLYSNVHLSNSLISSFSEKTECEPKHFIKNDDEYAQVCKKMTNLQH